MFVLLGVFFLFKTRALEIEWNFWCEIGVPPKRVLLRVIWRKCFHGGIPKMWVSWGFSSYTHQIPRGDAHTVLPERVGQTVSFLRPRRSRGHQNSMVIVTIGDNCSVVTIGSLEKKKQPQRREKNIGPCYSQPKCSQPRAESGRGEETHFDVKIQVFITTCDRKLLVIELRQIIHIIYCYVWRIAWLLLSKSDKKSLGNQKNFPSEIEKGHPLSRKKVEITIVW